MNRARISVHSYRSVFTEGASKANEAWDMIIDTNALRPGTFAGVYFIDTQTQTEKKRNNDREKVDRGRGWTDEDKTKKQGRPPHRRCPSLYTLSRAGGCVVG